MVATHEFRTRAGCEADRLASDPRVGDEMRATLAALADAVYRPVTPWIVVTVLTIGMLWPVGAFRKVEPPDDAEIARQIVRSKLRLIFALLTTSPLAFTLAIVVLVAGLLIHSSVNAVIDHRLGGGPGFSADFDLVLRHS